MKYPQCSDGSRLPCAMGCAEVAQGTQDPLSLTCHKLFVSWLDGSGFAPRLPFHMIKCIRVHEYANAGCILSHTI